MRICKPSVLLSSRVAWVVSLTGVLTVGTASAAEVRGLYKVGYDSGGDPLVTVTFNGGHRESIKSNNGYHFGGGVSVLSDDKRLEVEASLSYKYAKISASNGDVKWTRVPLEVLAFRHADKTRFGGGLTYHMHPDLDGTGVIAGLDTNFQSSPGIVMQGDWRLTKQLNIGLRYTLLEYKVDNSSATIDSNGLGIVFSGSF